MMPRLARLLAILALTLSPQMLLAADPGTLRLAYQTGDINTLTMYADAAHLFEKAGLKVTLIPFPAGPAILPAIAAGEVDMGWMGEFPIVTGFSNGVPITMVMVDRLNKTNARLVSRNGTGIDKITDLKGRKVAVSIGSTSHQQLVRALATVGMKQDEVTLVNLTPANMPAAFAAGQIDAALTWEPNISLMQKNGKVLATTESIGDITGVFLAGRPAFLKEQPELVQKFLAAWEVAMKDVLKSPDEIKQYEAKRLGLSVPDFSAMLDRMGATYPFYKEQLTQPYLGTPGQVAQSMMMAHLKDIGDFLLAEKRINALPKDWTGIIDTGPLQTFVAKTN